MKKCSMITITLADNPWLKTEAEINSLGYALLSFARAHEAKCLTHFDGEALRVIVQGLSKEVFAGVVTAWADSVRGKDRKVRYTQQDDVAMPLDFPGKISP